MVIFYLPDDISIIAVNAHVKQVKKKKKEQNSVNRKRFSNAIILIVDDF